MNNQIINTNNSSLKYYFALHIVILFYSMGGIFSKLASKQEFFSIKFCLCYMCIIGILFVYAIVWQQVLKYIPLTTAFCNKAVTIIWGIVWGTLVFKETIKINMIVGAFIVIIGVIIVVKSDAPDSKNKVIEEVSENE